MRIAAIVQARMTSARLPGKVLRPLRDKPLLQYLIERLRRAGRLDDIIVATSIDATDDAIERHCGETGVRCVRGSLLDVASRFLAALDAYPADAFVRISADSPLLDQRIVDAAIELYDGSVDIVTNKKPKTYPSGQSVEIVDAELFRRTLPRFEAGDDREHVTPFFYRHAEEFRIRSLVPATDLGACHMAVDTLADFERCRLLLASMDRPHWEYDLSALIELAAAVPSERLAR